MRKTFYLPALNFTYMPTSEEQRSDVYAYLVNFIESPTDANIETAALNAGVSKMSALAILGKMKNEPATFSRLIKMGYPMADIPKWVARPAPPPPAASAEKPAAPADPTDIPPAPPASALSERAGERASERAEQPESALPIGSDISEDGALSGRAGGRAGERAR
jgi:hypothetical protein